MCRGKLYGLFNVKWLFIFSVFLFEVGSAICGAANTMNVLIFGRTLAGMGGVGLYAAVISMLFVTITLKKRPLYIAFTGLVWGIGAVTR